jgi:3-hydroxyanthranilate 3,4-dioxygenase
VTGELPRPINFPDWLEEYGPTLKPPVGNREVFPGADDFVVMVVGGPNQRTDYHVDPYEEVFYQIKGNMHVNVQTGEGPRRIDIREGDMWVLPRRMPHSPQRPEPGSIGLVFERIREPGTLEHFRWYCPECNAVVHDVELQVRDIVTDLTPVFDAFYDSEAARTCPNCGAVHPGRQ